MEKSTPIGLVAGTVLVLSAIFLGDGWATFFDVKSVLIVGGGTLAALLVSYSFDDIKQIPTGLKDFFAFQPPNLYYHVENFSELSRVARREGLLALDQRLADIDDTLLAFGLEMAVDGMEEQEISDLMSQQIKEELEQKQLLVKFFNSAGLYAPAFGMIGTLIGLIQMLQNLNDPSAIGPAMAVAMITTFYGAFLANLLCLPIAVKVKTQISMTYKERMMMREGILAIVRGDSPTMIEKRLGLYLTDDASPAGEAADVTPLSKAA